MLSGFILVATIALALAFGILTAWGVLTVFLHAMSRRNVAPTAQAASVPHPQPSTS